MLASSDLQTFKRSRRLAIRLYQVPCLKSKLLPLRGGSEPSCHHAGDRYLDTAPGARYRKSRKVKFCMRTESAK